MVGGAVWLVNNGVLSYSCPRAGRGALSARLSPLIGCYFSEEAHELPPIPLHFQPDEGIVQEIWYGEPGFRRWLHVACIGPLSWAIA